MRVFRWEETIADGGAALSAFLRSWVEAALPGKGAQAFSALTVGDFDGCHLGHAALFTKVANASKNSLIEAGKAPGASSVLVPGAVTFQRRAHSPEKNGKPAGCISTLRQRLEAMAQCGLAFALVIDFSYNFSKMNGSDFLKMLAENALMRYLSVGEDFRCGYQLCTGQREIAQDAGRFGFAFEPLAQVVLDGRRVSSTEIREAVLCADFPAAERLMGRAFVLDISEVSWQLSAEKRGEQDLCAFCAKASAFSQILPPAGRYSAVLRGAETNPAECFCSFDGLAVLIECEEKLLFRRGKIATGEKANALFDGLQAYSGIEFLRSKHGSC